MKAIVYQEYGPPDVLRLEEVDRPTIQEKEVLVKVRATTVKYGDLVARNMGNISPSEFHMPFLFWLMARVSFGLRKPKRRILGSEFSGEVESVGSDVRRFGKGDQVFGYRAQSMGAYAEYVSMPEDGIVAKKPANLSFEEAASVPYGSIIALNLLKKVEIQSGQKVLINGASGALGSAALQLAKHYGAHVTGVCGTPRVEFVRSLGADQVIDYTQEDFTERDDTYDHIVDILGKSTFARCKNSLKEGGRYLLASFKFPELMQMLWTSRRGSKKVICALALEKAEDLAHIKHLIEAGEFKTVIGRRYPLDRTAEAHRYVESGQRRAHVVITVGQQDG